MYRYPWRRTCWRSQQGYSSMTSSGLSNSKMSLSLLASSVGPVSSASVVREEGASIILSSSKLGRASIFARASSIRLMTGAVLLSVRVISMLGARSEDGTGGAASAGADSCMSSSCGLALKDLDGLILSVRRASPDMDLSRRLSEIFLRCRLSDLEWAKPCLGSTVVLARAWSVDDAGPRP